MIQNDDAIDQPEDIPLYPRSSSFSLQRSFKQRLRSSRDVVASSIACIGAMSMGFALGYSSPALLDPAFQQILSTEDNRSWFGSLLTLGAMVGGPLAALCVGNLGRKTTLMLCNVPLGIGWFLIILATNTGIVVLFIGRFLTGLGVGSMSLVAPLYVAEVATSQRRGALGSGFQLLVTIGIFMSYTLGAALSWTWLAATGIILAFVHVISLTMVVETPRWLLLNHQREKANESLIWLRGDADAASEFTEMEQHTNVALMDGANRLTVRDVLSPNVYKPLLISTGLMVFQQLSGVNAVIFYTSDIFVKAGFQSSPSTPTIIVGAVLVGATVLSCIFADIAGRRLLLIVSGCFMCGSIVALGAYFYVSEVKHLDALGWLSLASLIVFVLAFSIGWGPLPWLIMSEVFPAKAKGFAGGIATAVNWLAAFITTKEFLHMASAIHDYGAFWAFGCVCAISVAFVVIFLPETKGKSLEQIEGHFAG